METGGRIPGKLAGARVGWRTHLMVLACLLTALGAFAGGICHGRWIEGKRTSFHDTRTMDPRSYCDLVDPDRPEVRSLAARYDTLQEAFLCVRDGLGFDPSLRAAGPGEVARRGEASCLGKAILPCSLYRALGKSHHEVRVMTGELSAPGRLADHAWLEIEDAGECYQQDPTPLLGTFAPEMFRDTQYSDAFIRRKYFCFNDAGFALVSQLDRLPGGHPPLPE